MHPTIALSTLQKLNRLRLAVLSIAAIALLTANFQLNIPLSLQSISLVLLLTAAFCLFVQRRLQNGNPTSVREVFHHLLIDLTILFSLLFFTGGATNPLVSLLLIPLTLGAILLSHRYILLLSLYAIALYSLLMRYFIPMHGTHSHTDAFSMHLFGMWISFLLSAVLIVFFLARLSASIRQKEMELTQAKETALRNQHLVALGTLAASTAHELGTPLGSIALLAEDLSAELLAHPELANQAIEIQRQVKSCKQSLRRLSSQASTSYLENGKILAVNEFLAEILHDWRQQYPQINIAVENRGELPAPCILADKTLSQAIHNILDNAAKVSSQIRWKNHWTEQQLQMEISDDGPGLDPAMADAIGKQSLAGKTQGMGIGLLLAHTIVKQLGGSIRHSNRDPHGLLTQIQIPLG